MFPWGLLLPLWVLTTEQEVGGKERGGRQGGKGARRETGSKWKGSEEEEEEQRIGQTRTQQEVTVPGFPSTLLPYVTDPAPDNVHISTRPATSSKRGIVPQTVRLRRRLMSATSLLATLPRKDIQSQGEVSEPVPQLV